MAATTWSRRVRPKSGRVSNTRQTSASSFLLHRQTSMPPSGETRRAASCEREVAGVELRSLGPDLADDAAPERVVAVHDHHLANRRQPAVEVAGGRSRPARAVVVAVRNVGDVFAERIVHRSSSTRTARDSRDAATTCSPGTPRARQSPHRRLRSGATGCFRPTRRRRTTDRTAAASRRRPGPRCARRARLEIAGHLLEVGAHEVDSMSALSARSSRSQSRTRRSTTLSAAARALNALFGSSSVCRIWPYGATSMPAAIASSSSQNRRPGNSGSVVKLAHRRSETSSDSGGGRGRRRRPLRTAETRQHRGAGPFPTPRPAHSRCAGRPNPAEWPRAAPAGVSFQVVCRRGGRAISEVRRDCSRCAVRTMPSAACFSAT